MNTPPSPLMPTESPGGGWVGVADLLVAGLVLFLVVGLAAASQLNTAQEQLRAAEAERDAQARRAADLEQQVNQLLLQSQQLQRQLQALRREYDEVQAQLLNATYILMQLEAQLDSTRRELQSVQYQLAQALKDVQNLTKRERELQAQIQTLLPRAKIVEELIREFAIPEADIVARFRHLIADQRELEELRRRVKMQDRVHPELVRKAMLFDEMTAAAKNQPKAEAVHAKLLAVKGSLKKVAIVLDFSGSMIESASADSKNRWAVAKDYINDVCQYLDMEECVLIVFSNEIKIFGRNNSTTTVPPTIPNLESDQYQRVFEGYNTKRPLREDETQILQRLTQLTAQDRRAIQELQPYRLSGAVNDRKLLTSLVAALPKPEGGTNTLKALNSAYAIDGVTNILLFTDGEPGLLNEQITRTEREKLRLAGVRVKPPDFPAQRGWVQDMLSKQKEEFRMAGKAFPPINAIGIGNYFDPDLSSFLRMISEEQTGGSFQGR
jgi:predicted  nucleic acid-binding Zn-ribbon protein